MNNPLTKSSEQPFGTIPFNEINKDDFIPAIDDAIIEGNVEIESIVNNVEQPTFENTILSFELSGATLSRVASTYFHLFGSESDQSFQDLAQIISPKLAKYDSDIMLNENLFKKIKKVYDNKQLVDEPEDIRLLELTYLEFVRNGANLDKKEKDILRKLDEELSTLSPQFSNNTLNATNAFELWLDKGDLDGLPDSIRDSAKVAAKAKDKDDKWLITGQFPSFAPFLKFSSRRDLREKVYKAINTKCNGGEFDNTLLCKKISKLKHKRAKVLGYDNYADYVLEERMAEKQSNIFQLLDSLYETCIGYAENELKEVTALAKEIDGLDAISPWDFSYYSEKLKQDLYDFNEDSLRPYFSAEKVMEGVFEVAKRLYGLEFDILNNIQTWHEDVHVYEVKNAEGNHIGILYEDLFPRETKRSGAWMNQLRQQGMGKAGIQSPHVTFTCNLTKPTDDKPSLLTLSEVTTIFHEFGHSLHGLLSKRKYKKIAGTSVFWDFVELPSQIMENWVFEKEALSLFAYHYESGELIPDFLLKKIKDSKNFMSGTMCLRQLTFGYLDMSWFGKDNEVADVEEFEWNAIKKTSLFEKVPGASISCQLGHIFAGGYSAGYYSYKWAEVLEADAFEKFKEDGIFNKETAKSFRENILSQGNIEHPMKLYKKFRGREPKVTALLRRDGLLA